MVNPITNLDQSVVIELKLEKQGLSSELSKTISEIETE